MAVATLALSAGVVLAGGGAAMPDAAADGLQRAEQASGKVVPVVNVPAVPDVAEQPAEPAEEEPAEEEPAEEPDGAKACELLPEGSEYANHGAKVCAAAQAEVPEDYANRGAYVRGVARDNHGAEVRAQKAANGGVPDAAKAAKEKAKEKARSEGAGAGAGADAAGGGGRP